MMIDSQLKNRFNSNSRGAQDTNRVLNGLNGTNPLDIIPMYQPVYNAVDKNSFAKNAGNGFAYSVSQAPPGHNLNLQLQLQNQNQNNTIGNSKNYVRNMQMLQDITGKLPIDQKYQTPQNHHRSDFGQRSFFHHTKMEKPTFRKKNKIMANTDNVIANIQKRASTASKTTHGASTRRRNIERLQKTHEAGICEKVVSIASDGAPKVDFWDTEHTNSVNQTVKMRVNNPLYDGQFNKIQTKNLDAEPLSEFGGKLDQNQGNGRILVTEPRINVSNSFETQKPLDAKRIKNLITAPLHSLKEPIKKFSLSISKHSRFAKDEARSIHNRLYIKSKQMHHDLKDNPLRYLKSINKELNQNYDMFEKPRISGANFCTTPDPLKTTTSPVSLKSTLDQDGTENILSQDFLSDNQKGDEATFVMTEHQSKAKLQAELTQTKAAPASSLNVRSQNSVDPETGIHVASESTAIDGPRKTATADIGLYSSSTYSKGKFTSAVQTLMLTQESLKHILQERLESHPQIEVNDVMTEANFMYRTVLSSIRGNKSIEDSISHSLSLLWKYVIILVDQCLYQQKAQYDALENKLENEIEKCVAERMKRFETEVQKERLKYETLEAEKSELQKQFVKKDVINKKLNDHIVQQDLRFESLRDPTGLQQFKRLITSFTSGIDSIHAEKEQQYATMKQVVHIMDEMGENTYLEDKLLKKKNRKLRNKIDQLEEQLEQLVGSQSPNELGLPGSSGKTKGQIERENNRALRRKATMIIIKNKDTNFQWLSQLPITEQMRQLTAGLNISDETINAFRLVIADQIGDSVQKSQRDDFLRFYEKEIQMARQMGATMTEKVLNPAIAPKLEEKHGTEKLLTVMQNYFMGLARSPNGMGGNRIGTIEEVDRDSNDLTDELGSDYSDRGSHAGTRHGKRSRKTSAARRRQQDGTQSHRKRAGGGHGIEGLEIKNFASTTGAVGGRRHRDGRSRRNGSAKGRRDKEGNRIDKDGNQLRDSQSSYYSYSEGEDFDRETGQATKGGHRRRHRRSRRGSQAGSDGSYYSQYDGEDIDGQVNKLGFSPDGSPLKSGGRGRNRTVGRDGLQIRSHDGPINGNQDSLEDQQHGSNDSRKGGRGQGSRHGGGHGGGQNAGETPRDADGRPLREGDYQPGSIEDQMRANREGQGSADNSFDRRGSDDGSVVSGGGFGGVFGTSLKKVNDIKSRINTGLADADGSKNSRIIKKQLDLMKNPIISAIKKTLKVNAKNKKKLPKDYYIAMVPSKIFELMDNVMQEKVWVDIEAESGPIETRSAIPFHTFMYDVMIMKFGLQSIAIKTLIQMTNGLNFEQKSSPFAHTLSNMIGMAIPPYRLDEIQIVLRAHLFFKMVQENWIQKQKTNHKYNEITKEDESNLNRGGNCGIFDLIDEIKTAFVHEKEIAERICTNIRPDICLQRSPNRPKLELRYSVLKVTNRIAKMGKDPKWVYKELDTDGNGTLDADEILTGIKKVLGVFFSKEETREFTNHLDEDQSGDIDLHEFCQRIYLDNLHIESHKYLISELTFVEKVLQEWYTHKANEKKTILELIDQYDDNKDGVMQLSEFETMLKALEPNVTKKNIIMLFKEALSMADEDSMETDAISPEILIRQIQHYKIGGYGKEFFSNYLSKRKAKFIDKHKKKKK